MSQFCSSSLTKLTIASVSYYLDDNVLRIHFYLFWSVSFLYSASAVPPRIAGDLRVPENISIVEKNPVSLVCEASGIPLPAITWLKNGWPVTSNNSVRILSGTKAVVCLFVLKQWGGRRWRALCISSADISHGRRVGLIICKDKERQETHSMPNFSVNGLRLLKCWVKS